MRVSERVRRALAEIGDVLIPAAHGMPSAREVGIGGEQLDIVLAARPDLGPVLERALEDGASDASDTLEALRVDDPEAYDALLLTVVAGYYLHPEVRTRIGYPGQAPKDARALGERELEELWELVEAVRRRGPIYRPTPT